MKIDYNKVYNIHVLASSSIKLKSYVTSKILSLLFLWEVMQFFRTPKYKNCELEQEQETANSGKDLKIKACMGTS